MKDKTKRQKEKKLFLLILGLIIFTEFAFNPYSLTSAMPSPTKNSISARASQLRKKLAAELCKYRLIYPFKNWMGHVLQMITLKRRQQKSFKKDLERVFNLSQEESLPRMSEKTIGKKHELKSFGLDLRVSFKKKDLEGEAVRDEEVRFVNVKFPTLGTTSSNLLTNVLRQFVRREFMNLKDYDIAVSIPSEFSVDVDGIPQLERKTFPGTVVSEIDPTYWDTKMIGQLVYLLREVKRLLEDKHILLDLDPKLMIYTSHESEVTSIYEDQRSLKVTGFNILQPVMDTNVGKTDFILKKINENPVDYLKSKGFQFTRRGAQEFNSIWYESDLIQGQFSNAKFFPARRSQKRNLSK